MNQRTPKPLVIFKYTAQSLANARRIDSKAIEEVRKQLDGLESLLDPKLPVASAAIELESRSESYSFPGEGADRVGTSHYITVKITADTNADFITTSRKVLRIMGAPYTVHGYDVQEGTLQNVFIPEGYALSSDRDGGYSPISMAQIQKDKDEKIKYHKEELKKLSRDN